jgi:hypothetical protein
VEKLGVVHRLVCAKVNPEALTARDHNHKIVVLIRVKNEFDQMNYFRKIMDILEVLKTEFITFVINSDTIAADYSKLVIDESLKKSYFEFKKQNDEENAGELGFLNSSDNFLKPNNKGTTKIYKINKETL